MSVVNKTDRELIELLLKPLADKIDNYIKQQRWINIVMGIAILLSVMGFNKESAALALKLLGGL